MRNELYQIEEIEHYLEGRMGEEQRLVFENRMRTDEALRNQVRIQEQLTQQIRLNAFKNEVLNFHAKYTETATIKSKGYGFYFNSLILFGVIGLVAASVYYFMATAPDQEQTISSLAQKHNSFAGQQQNGPVSGTTVVPEKNPNEPGTAVRPELVTNTKKPITAERNDLPAPSAEDTPCRSFLLSFHTQKIDASVGGDVVTRDSRSVIHFPAGILIDQNDQTVTGPVEIHYREFRNAAQMAYSQIPMVYNEKGKQYHFNSTGMFEIRAYQGDQELKIRPGASFMVDYNMTENRDSCFFFALDEKTKTWKKINKIEYRDEPLVEKTDEDPALQLRSGQIFIRVRDAVTGKNISKKVYTSFVNPSAEMYASNICLDSGYNVSSIAKGTYNMQLSLDGYMPMKMADITVNENRITYVEASLTPTKRVVPRAVDEKTEYAEKAGRKHSNVGEKKGLFSWFSKKPKNLNNFIMRMSGDKTVQLPRSAEDKKQDEVKSRRNKEHFMLRDSMLVNSTNAGHYVPGMVKGLECKSFGIYNCDQIYLLREPLTIKATYKNAAGETIQNGYVLSMIDLKYNGAFSSDPAGFTCSRTGENVLLLFTRDNKLYVLPHEEFRRMGLETSGNYTFVLTDLTAAIKNAEDLRQYLHLEKD